VDEFIVIMGCVELFSNNSTVTVFPRTQTLGNRDLDGRFSVRL